MRLRQAASHASSGFCASPDAMAVAQRDPVSRIYAQQSGDPMRPPDHRARLVAGKSDLRLLGAIAGFSSTATRQARGAPYLQADPGLNSIRNLDGRALGEKSEGDTRRRIAGHEATSTRSL